MSQITASPEALTGLATAIGTFVASIEGAKQELSTALATSQESWTDNVAAQVAADITAMSEDLKPGEAAVAIQQAIEQRATLLAEYLAG